MTEENLFEGIKLTKPVVRQEVRYIAMQHYDELKNASQSNVNIFQLEIDQKDKINHYLNINLWSDDDKSQFMSMYAEEINALASSDEVDTLNQMSEKVEAYNFVSIAVTVIVILICLVIFLK